VILEALVVFAREAVLLAPPLEPLDIMGFQIQPQSVIIVIVEIRSSQKKKDKKYPSFTIHATMISVAKQIRQNRVQPQKI
jgi:hypothetical protein